MHALQRMLFLRQLQYKTSCLNRLASTHKRRTAALPTDQLKELRETYFQTRTTLATDEWQQVRQTLINNYRHINDGNVDAVILGVCNQPEQLPLAKDYIRYLNEAGTQPNQATLGRLLRVYNAAYHNRGGTATALNADEQQDILEICEQLRGKHELLDATTCENLIHGLVATPNWLEAKNMLEMMKVTTNTASISAYTELIVKAFCVDDKALAWLLLEEMAVASKQPKCEIYLAYLNQITNVRDIEQMFHFLERHDLLITQPVADALVQMSVKWPAALAVQDTTLTRLGKCQTCAQQLQHVSISDEEFERLRSGFLDKVLIRKDIFQKSTPAEVSSFKRYIEETAPYDCVIDGLNVAYSTGAKKPPQELAKLLAAVVHHFRTRHKHVLVLGRKHMKSWSKEAMNYVHKHASVFLTNNLSHDDPFLLYATLKSGPTADFFSRDLMRTHAHLLGTELKSIFRRWQQEHQYSLVTQTDTGKIIVKEPIRHRLSAHKVNDTWHIPCRAAYAAQPAESFEVPEHWLCVKIKK